MPVAKKERTDHKCLGQRKKDQTTNACGKDRKNRPQMPVTKKEDQTTNACGKDRKNRPQMPVTKKERPNHKCLWQRKKEQITNACGKERKNRSQMPVGRKKDQTTNAGSKQKMAAQNQASKQLIPNERNKKAETTSKTQTVGYLQA